MGESIIQLLTPFGLYSLVVRVRGLGLVTASSQQHKKDLERNEKERKERINQDIRDGRCAVRCSTMCAAEVRE